MIALLPAIALGLLIYVAFKVREIRHDVDDIRQELAQIKAQLSPHANDPDALDDGSYID